MSVTEQLRTEGIALIPGAFSSQECRSFISKLDTLAKDYNRRGLVDFDADVVSLPNFIRHDPDLLSLIYNPAIDDALQKMIDDDYVLIAATANNRMKQVDNPHKLEVGDNWHTDSRYVGGRRLDWGFSYLVCVMLEAFTEHNAATLYVPKSHLDRTMPDRFGNYSYETLKGDAGTIAIMDSGLWHRGGSPSRQSRWSTFSIYGPWFMKPYFRYQDMFTKPELDKLSPTMRRLLHVDSVPPLNEDEGLATLRRVREREVRPLDRPAR